ncbi:MAG: prepilin-type N-terminal cleavage/methylation domain-containing protein [Cryobacterium sp.]|nr:prepilin-type N-terminal cleavage/methylation domain-containing protein [Oligoflexia bacterium]
MRNTFFAVKESIDSAADLCAGFTLLEVMIAMAIMLVSFSSILAIQSSSMSSVQKSRQTHEVSMLARKAMAETEVEIAGKKFEELPTELTGTFDDPYQDYTFTRKIKEVKLPNLAGISKAAQGDKQADSRSSNSQDEDKNSQMMEQMTKVLTNFLSKALREVTITVEWKRGITVQKYEVAMYWVDLNSDVQINP